jgi:hypothetical protein
VPTRQGKTKETRQGEKGAENERRCFLARQTQPSRATKGLSFLKGQEQTGFCVQTKPNQSQKGAKKPPICAA